MEERKWNENTRKTHSEDARLSTICIRTLVGERGYINSDVGLINEPRNRRDLSSQR